MKASNLRNMAVVSVQDGTRLGRVEQPLIDLPDWTLAALQVKGDSGSFVLPFREIERIGTDAITVPSEDVTRVAGTGGAIDRSVDLGTLEKLKVVDQNGTYLGTVSEVEVDPASGQIIQLSAHHGGVFGIGGETTTLGRDALAGVGTDILTVRVAPASTAPDDAQSAGPDENAASSH